MLAHLALADGTLWQGTRIGAQGTAVGELVFNTGMTGYQEILTDPSYAGQIVTFTYPLIGNTGINDDDYESDSIQPRSVVVRGACSSPSNWRSRETLDAFLARRGMVGIAGVDTRAIVQRIREGGAVMGSVSTSGPDAAVQAAREATSYEDEDFVSQVTTPGPYAWGPAGRERVDRPADVRQLRAVVIDCGLKFSALRRLAALGVRPIVLPARSTVDDVMSWEPHGVMISSGPGDPARLTSVVATTRSILGERPIFGICLGSQVLSQAIGGRTFKLKFGHRGSNHPVKNLSDGQVTITSQNHGYAVDAGSIDGTGGRVSQLNLNDGTVEGIEVPGADAFGVQYHPEAAPGPWDSRPYFVRFVEAMERVCRA